MVAKVRAVGLNGIDGYAVETEGDFRMGDAKTVISIVGLPDTAMKEARDRISLAVVNSGCCTVYTYAYKKEIFTYAEIY